MNANEQQTYILAAGQILSITAPTGTTGSVVRLPRLPGSGNVQSITAIAGENLTFGPYSTPERFDVICTVGTVTVSMAEYDPLSPSITPDLLCIDEKTPVNAVASSGTLTAASGGDTIVDGDTVTIGSKTYTFKTALTPTEGQVLIGANDTAALLNLKNAINHEGTPNTDYKCAAVHPTVTGTSSNATTCVVTAKTKGTAGDSIATTETGANLSWGHAHLEGGIDGTLGSANETCADASYLYHCVATNTITDANWRRVSLGSAY